MNIKRSEIRYPRCDIQRTISTYVRVVFTTWLSFDKKVDSPNQLLDTRYIFLPRKFRESLQEVEVRISGVSV